MKRWQKRLASMLFITFLLITAGCAGGNDVPAEPVGPVEEPLPEPVSISLMAVGDNLIHGPVFRQAKERGNGTYDFGFAFAEVEEFIQAADIAILNQETPLGGNELGISSYPMFNSPQELGDHMINIGFDVINHANNHIIDKGSKGFNGTIAYWQDKPGVLMTGVYPDDFSADQLQIIRKDGVDIAFLAYTYGTNGLSLPASSPGLINWLDEDKILADLAFAEEHADISVLLMHWGNEYQHHASSNQEKLAETLAAAGADIIIGSHPHVVQGVETITQADGRETVVFYSLGNFISGQNRADTMIEGLAEIDLTFNPNDGSIEFDRVQFVPLINHYGPGHSDVYVLPFSEYTEEMAANHGVKEKDSQFNYQFILDYLDEVVPEEYINPPEPDALAEPAGDEAPATEVNA